MNKRNRDAMFKKTHLQRADMSMHASIFCLDVVNINHWDGLYKVGIAGGENRGCKCQFPKVRGESFKITSKYLEAPMARTYLDQPQLFPHHKRSHWRPWRPDRRWLVLHQLGETWSQEAALAHCCPPMQLHPRPTWLRREMAHTQERQKIKWQNTFLALEEEEMWFHWTAWTCIYL